MHIRVKLGIGIYILNKTSSEKSRSGGDFRSCRLLWVISSFFFSAFFPTNTYSSWFLRFSVGYQVYFLKWVDPKNVNSITATDCSVNGVTQWVMKRLLHNTQIRHYRIPTAREMSTHKLALWSNNELQTSFVTDWAAGMPSPPCIPSLCCVKHKWHPGTLGPSFYNTHIKVVRLKQTLLYREGASGNVA